MNSCFFPARLIFFYCVCTSCCFLLLFFKISTVASYEKSFTVYTKVAYCIKGAFMWSWVVYVPLFVKGGDVVFMNKLMCMNKLQCI